MLTNLIDKLIKILLSISLSALAMAEIALSATYFEHINSQNGLISNKVHHVIQRKNGLIWIGTAEGLSRYDGYQFVNYTNDPDDNTSLSNDWVFALFEDSQERLWVGTSNGLSRLLPNERGFRQYKYQSDINNSIASASSHFITEDSEGRIWVGTDQGLSQYRPQTDDFKTYRPAPLLLQNSESNTINFILEVGKNQFWVGSNNGLFSFNSISGEFVRTGIASLPNNFDYGSYVRDRRGLLWFATYANGVIAYDPTTQAITHYQNDKANPNSLASNQSWHIGEDIFGRIWVTSLGNGVNIIDPTNQSITRLKHKIADDRSIPHDHVTSVLQDSSGAMWISTQNGLAFHHPHQTIENLHPIPGDKDSLSGKYVWSFQETSDALWIGTEKGLNRLDPQTGRIKTYTSSHNSDVGQVNAVWKISVADDDHLWLGTEEGLLLFNINTGMFSHVAETIAKDGKQNNQEHAKILSEPVWSLTNSVKGSLWVANTAGRLIRINRKLEIVEDLTELVRNSIGQIGTFEFTNVFEDNHHNIWLTTSIGMFFLDRVAHTITPLTLASGEYPLKGIWVNSLEHFKDDLYWVGSYSQGLLLFELKKDGLAKKHYSLLKNHPEFETKNVFSVSSIDQDNIWFTSSSNLYRFNYTSDEIVNFGKRFFRNDINFHENAYFKDSSGYLNLGSSRGVVRFRPGQIQKHDYSPKLIFTNIQIPSLPRDSQEPSRYRSINSQTPIHQLQDWTFAYTENVIKFNFASLDYMRPWNLEYAYRLLGFSSRWTELGKNREVTFTNLDAGDYILEIKGTNRDLVWSKNHSFFRFTVEPKPWKTWWANSIYGLILISLMLIFYRFIHRELLTQRALEQSENQLIQALWGSGDELWEWDIKAQKISRKNAFKIFDYRSSQFSGYKSTLVDIIHPDDLDSFTLQLQRIVNLESNQFEAIYRRLNNQKEWVWLLDRAKVTLKGANDEPLRLSGTTRNITSLKLAEENNRLIASAFQSSTDGAIIYDQNLTIFALNTSFTEITGLDESIINDELDFSLFSLDQNSQNDLDFHNEITRALEADGIFRTEAWVRSTNGDRVPVDFRIASVNDENHRTRHFIATITDILFRKQAEADLRKLANFDSLTQLPNRTLLHEQLNHGLLQAKREHTSIAVLFLDLDNFKNINDSLGHNVGDKLLIAVAERLRANIRSTDIVARLGGDEFTLVLFGIYSINMVIKLTEDILQKLNLPYKLQENEIAITPSIGIAMSPQDGIDVDTLLRHADTAMYHAKQSGRNNFQFFTLEMNQRVTERLKLESQLRQALKNHEFEIHYQPKFDLNKDCISGFEALLRWKQPEEGWIPPLKFIPIAEETGLILPISEMVLDTVCRQIKDWQENELCSIQVAVNLSALQFKDKHLPLKIKQTLEKYQLEADCIELEITEGTLMENMAFTSEMLNKLRKVGVKLSLDDFGTGYSSLSYLKQFPIHKLKIDRSFVMDIAEDTRDAKMVDAIITLAHNLDVTVVGEGIETEQQLQMLKEFNCEEVQGFLLSKPLPASQAIALLRRKTTVSSLLSKGIF